MDCYFLLLWVLVWSQTRLAYDFDVVEEEQSRAELSYDFTSLHFTYGIGPRIEIYPRRSPHPLGTILKFISNLVNS